MVGQAPETACPPGKQGCKIEKTNRPPVLVTRVTEASAPSRSSMSESPKLQTAAAN